MSSRIVTAEMMLEAYALGIFPMALSREIDDLVWMEPRVRGVIDLSQGFHVPRRLVRYMRHSNWVVRWNTAFHEVLKGCAHETPVRDSTWINRRLTLLYGQLHTMGYAHSVEVWQLSSPKTGTKTDATHVDATNSGETHVDAMHVDATHVDADHVMVASDLSSETSQPSEKSENGAHSSHDVLVGGLFGIAMGGVFMGESMFSFRPSASQFALVSLAEQLFQCGYVMLDCQFHNDHLDRFGCQQIPRAHYIERLTNALKIVPRPFPHDGWTIEATTLADSLRRSRSPS